MPTPIPIIAASCGVQSTTSSTRVPTTAISERLTTIANRALSSGSPIATTPSVRNSTSAATRMPKISPAPPCSAVDQWMMSPPSATWTPPLPSSVSVSSAIVLTFAGVDVAGALAELDLGERDPAVLGDGRARANGSPTASTSGDFAISARTALDLRAVAGVEHATLVDREDDAGGVARLLREALLEQVVGPLRLGPRKAEVVDEVAGGGAPQHGTQDEGGDPQADHGTASIVAPGGKLAHRPKIPTRCRSFARATRTPLRVVAPLPRQSRDRPRP